MNDGVQQHTNRWGKFELMCVVFQLLPVSELPNAPICSQNPTAETRNKIQNGPYLCPLSSFLKGLNGLLGRDLYINTIFINCITKPFTNLVKYFLEAVAATHATPVDPPLTECKKNWQLNISAVLEMVTFLEFGLQCINTETCSSCWRFKWFFATK